MTLAMFLVADLSAGFSETVELTGAEAHHAATVKRLTVGEHVLLCDGRGTVVTAEVCTTAADKVVLTVLERSEVPAPNPRFVVVQALPKGDRAELAVEVMTELGVDEIVPWESGRSIVRWQGERAARGVAKWRKVATEASKQSRRSRIPVVAELADTAAVATRLAGADLALVLHEDATQSLATIELPVAGEIVLVVGPEGGISDDELSQLSAAGAVAVRLGPEILRTSTAGAAALAVLSARSQRWR